MDFSDELAAYLAGVTDVNAIVGAADHSRIFQHVARQTVKFPLIVIEERGGQASELLAGQTTGLAMGSYMVMSCGLTSKEATNLHEAVRQNLETYIGDMGSAYVHGALLDSSWRDRDAIQPQDGSQEFIYFVNAQYSIWHTVPLEKV